VWTVPKKVDRRMQRNRQLLREALLSLVREKGFEPVRVQDIIDRANVGRATFYAHFDNKEDLLLSGLDELRSSLKNRQRQALGGSGPAHERLFAFSRELFEHAEAHRELIRAMAKERSAGLVRQALHRIVVDLARADVEAVVTDEAGSAAAEAVVQFTAGALFGFLTWWLEARSRPGVQEADALFRRLAMSALRDYPIPATSRSTS
jgi:AcrR family transcriptional regulator